MAHFIWHSNICNNLQWTDGFYSNWVFYRRRRDPHGNTKLYKNVILHTYAWGQNKTNITKDWLYIRRGCTACLQDVGTICNNNAHHNNARCCSYGSLVVVRRMCSIIKWRVLLSEQSTTKLTRTNMTYYVHIHFIFNQRRDLQWKY